MSRTMIQAAVTMNQLQQKLDLIGNNLANSQTTGYKARQADFSSLLFQQINNMTDPRNAEGRLTPDGIRVGSGARLGAINLDLSLGTLKETGRDLDVALLEQNYLFKIRVTENNVEEIRYTRDGAFYLSPLENNQVMLTTKDGDPVLGVGDQPIIFNDGFDGITISDNGQIMVNRGNYSEYVGQLAVVEAVRPRLLEATGNNNFRLPDLNALNYNEADIIQDVQANVKSGTLETSNVNMAKELTDLITTQRSYQFNARTISMGDQMMGLINQLRS
ncbi:flagellar hook-basal body protein [Ornithinibacillus bavariensis]|uniref:Flagellar hook-basal body complex protein FlhP n=1 Tax=Ornithinibacillus bavariensis TaxID=545502 RepID=A0A919X9J9_9BACI|nr:flagellar hook-basal body protein [Ornithinibacillus bavariensis]GIO26887.1 flagellar hook-basal body complex protein FlhP [Ornithinibacillus bavariensis]